MSTISLRPQGTPLGGGGVGWVESWDFRKIVEKPGICLAQVMIIGAPQVPPTKRKILDSKCSVIRRVSARLSTVRPLPFPAPLARSASFCLNGSRRHHSVFAFTRECTVHGTVRNRVSFMVEAFATTQESSTEWIIISRLYRTRAK